ncbi:hypothetical protein Tco_1093301 [Tanacetum coccineum]|uniref:Uncharacterized protein n=1 Tax=Tanacetum coccineum TaxID=301880 RepID=A0ABQ5ICE3_9ASTR
MQNLERQLNKETLHEKDSNSGLSMIKVQFDNFIHSRVLELSNSNSHALEITQDIKSYTNMKARTFKETIIQNMDSIEQCIVERACHEQELQNRLKRLNERKLQIQECKIQEVKASNACSRDTNSSEIVFNKGNDQSLENHSNTSGDESSRSRNECNYKRTYGDDTDIRPSYDTEPMVEVPYTDEYNVFVVDTQHSEQPECIINTCVVEKVDNNVIPDSPNMCGNEIQNDQNVVECDDERVALANLIANLKLDVDENKKIQKQLKKANTTLAHELTECKSILAETSRTLGESNSIRDSCLVALQIYKLGLRVIDIKEGLKLKAYEISVVKEKHDELVKQSLLTKSHYEGLVKEKRKVITDLKLKEEKDIDKIISMEKQLKFLNEIIYKKSQSIQTLHMLAPKCLTFNGRPTFANPMYLKKDQYKKPCLYEIPHNQSDPANRLVPDREETLTLEKESRSKLNKDLVKPYDYTMLNGLYEIFKPPAQEYLVQLAHANEVRKKMWRKSFVKTKPNIFKNIDFLHVSKSISKSRQAYNVMTNNINHLRELVDQAWVKHSKDHFHAPTAHDTKILIKTCLMPLSLKTQNDSFAFVHELKQEMRADLKYVESLENEIDELESDKAEFSNMYDILLQECVSNDVMCSYLHSLSDLDAHACNAYMFIKHRIASQVGVSHDLTKPVTPHSWPQVRKSSLAKPYDVNAPRIPRNSPKHVSFQSPRESVGSNDMVHNYYLEESKKKAQLQKDKPLNTKPSV